MSLPPRPSAILDWPAEIGAVAETEMKDTIAFYTPGADEVRDSDFNIITPAQPPALLFQSKARVQHFRSTTDAYDVNQAVNLTSVRAQVPLTAGRSVNAFIHRGMFARVLVSAKFPKLLHFPLIVESAINSTHAAVQTITFQSELSKAPPVTP